MNITSLGKEYCFLKETDEASTFPAKPFKRQRIFGLAGNTKALCLLQAVKFRPYEITITYFIPTLVPTI